jgi:DNA-3-methyladenine glycosylase II
MTRRSPLPSRSDLRALTARDPSLGRAMRRVPAYPGVSSTVARMSNFHYLCRAIIYQQLAGVAAHAIYTRVRTLTPGTRFPTARQMLDLPVEHLRGAGLSSAKTRSILDLAEHLECGRLRLRGAASLADEELVARLTRVRGIGEWTAQMYLMFKLGRLDVMPATDLGVREGLRRLDGLGDRPAAAAVLVRAEPWRPLRTVAAWVLWRLTDV